MPSLIVVGMQWGDEGKGKIVDLLASQADAVVRFQGGANAGHTVIVDGVKTVLHLVPSGVLNDKSKCVIASGVVVDPSALIDELEMLKSSSKISAQGRLFLSRKANFVMPYHKDIDALREKLLGSSSIGTTGRGIGPCYEDRVARLGVRADDLCDLSAFRKKFERIYAQKKLLLESLGGQIQPVEWYLTKLEDWAKVLSAYVCDTEHLLHCMLSEGRSVLLEGAQGTMLDVDHGTYPFVTSSSTVAGGACTGAGIGPKDIDVVLGIIKAYTTRVGNGPFPTELMDDDGIALRERGKEVGATTGRPRRCGWFDGVVASYSAKLNGVTSVAITKLDVLSGFEKIRVCVAYDCNGRRYETIPPPNEFAVAKPIYVELDGWTEDVFTARSYESLPEAAKRYVEFIERILGVPADIVSVGRERSEVFLRSKLV